MTTSPTVDLARFVRGLPKAELHLHIEGTLEPELMLDLGARNGVQVPYANAGEARAAYRFSDLRSFLNLYYRGMAVLLHERDFYELTAAYLRRAAADGTRHVEIFFDPQSHLVRGVAFAEVVDGIRAALDDGRREFGISSRLIMCFLRDESPASALEVLEQARAYRDRIAGVGLDSAEVGHPPGDFAHVFAAARAAGFAAVAHAGEEGPAAYVSEALDLLRVTRIDHGVRAIDDAALVARLRASASPSPCAPCRTCASAWSPTSPSTRSSACSTPACRSPSTPTTPPTSAAIWSTTTWRWPRRSHLERARPRRPGPSLDRGLAAARRAPRRAARRARRRRSSAAAG